MTVLPNSGSEVTREDVDCAEAFFKHQFPMFSTFLSEASIKEIARAFARSLKSFGYERKQEGGC